MHEKTVALLVITKWLELGYLLTLLGCMIPGCVQLIKGLNGELVYISVLSVISLVLALYHILYINILTNCRFKCRCRNGCCRLCEKSTHNGKDITSFECFNFLICYMCLHKICAERPNWYFAAKWTFKYLFFGVLIGLIKWQKILRPELFVVDTTLEDNMQFDNLLILYAL